jgi:invasion protein IalB
MSRMRLFFLALLLASTAVTDGEVIAKQQLGDLGSSVKGAPRPARRTFAQSAPIASAAQLPNGASSVSELYGSWTVDCRMADGQKQCRLLQIQTSNQTNQKLVVEFRVPQNGKLEGTIILPFGLKLDSGGRLKLDDKDLDIGLRFLTCVPAGCVLPVSFSMTGVDAMKNSKILTVASLTLSNEIAAFNVPLDGFASAISRVVELSRWKPSNSSTIQGEAGD